MTPPLPGIGETTTPTAGWSAFVQDFAFCRALCDGRTSQALASYGLYAVAVYRFGRAVDGVRWRLLRRLLLIPYHVLRIMTDLVVGISVARTAEIGAPLMFHHHGGVFIAAGCRIGPRCQIFQGVTVGESGGRRPGRPTVGGDVVIGAGAKILGDVTIGAGARIGANAVVVTDVPAGAVAVGVPATVHGEP